MTLKCNLQEIYAAAHSPNGEMVADPTGRYVYSKNAGWGIFWSWIYKIANFLGIDDFAKNCFERAMVHTHRLFSEQLSKVIESCESYETNLKKRYLGEKICEKENAAHRQRISQWYRNVAPFIRYVKEGPSASLTRIVSTSFADEFCQKYKVPLSEGSYSTLIKRQRRIIKLEGILKLNMPVNLLIKASKKSPLCRSEKESLKKFVRKINDDQQNIGVRTLHHALLNVIQRAKKFSFDVPGAIQPDITTLEMELLKIDCPVILQKDPKHMAKRNFKSGDSVVCNHRLLKIGERLGTVHEGDQNVVFTTDDPNVAVVIGINAVLHPLKRMLAYSEGWGIQSAEYIDIDHKTGVALVERLYDHLGSFKWTSNSNLINSVDEDVAMPLWRLLRWFVEKNSTPLNFSPKYLMFDRRGILKCLKVTTKGELDFNSLVKFADETSSGNPHIFRYLMQKSELIGHKYAKFYEDILKYAIKNEEESVQNIATSRGIIDHRIIGRGKEFEKEVLNLKERCMKQIKPERLLADPKVFEQKVSEQLLTSYLNSAAAGLLPDNLEKEIIAKVNLKNRLKV
ncbi:MAG: hypothetical protein H0U49_03340 [Parachlamydiaceae bacterium]|nr:hypothetical protein [Parachlamydiaceae bacterium]